MGNSTFLGDIMISEEDFKGLFVDHLGVDGAFVDMKTTFDEDLAASSEECETMRKIVNRRYRIKITPEQWLGLLTLGDALEVARKVDLDTHGVKKENIFNKDED